MNVVIVNEQMPYPPTAGNRIRTLNLMLRLARRHRISYLCRASEDADELRQSIAHLADHGIQTIVADQAPSPKRGAAFYARLAANLVSRQPYAVASHNSPAVREAIRSHARQNRVDLWQFEWLAYADALSGPPGGACTLVMAHNIESLIWQRYWQTEPHPLRRWYIRQQWRKFQRYEKRIFAQASGVVTVSPEDATIAQEQFGVQQVAVVDNGIDKAYFASVRRRPEPRTLLFLGSLDWRPNQDAIRLLLDRIFPQVRTQEPQARLLIVGRNPPPWLLRCAQEQQQANVELHANVPDVRPFLASAGVMAVPLRIGGGSRLKILEALACGVPVVSTRVGYEGLALTPGRDLLVADKPQEMADALVRCLRKPEEAAALGEAGRTLVLSRYDWDVLAARLEGVWEELLSYRLDAAAAARQQREQRSPQGRVALDEARSEP